ncbi:hypothetical protein SAMN05216238_10721 [Lentibacillus persicus]|uniref:DUF3953 domain-containing protein n=1 Tax=Lentibacillus persicus TaxID=640948 RepID=A0A1I1X344_9BACI|nr:hypothetical protein [Lentibacillus persicus]SFE00083.1 hypothetical protein SAMN05216238_10721 [Lentibacillus persicus]
MSILRIANIIIAIAMIIFISFPELPSEVVFTFIPVIFLLFGVDEVRRGESGGKITGYFYIIAGIITLPGLIIELF